MHKTTCTVYGVVVSGQEVDVGLDPLDTQQATCNTTNSMRVPRGVQPPEVLC